MVLDEATPLLSLVGKLPDIFREAKSDSLVEYTRPTRNDFLTVVEDGLITEPYMADVMQSTLSMVSGYFLSAVTLVVDIPGIEVVKTLDKLNTSRDPIESVLGAGAAIHKFVGTESFQYGLPSHGSVGLEAYGLEAKGDRIDIYEGDTNVKIDNASSNNKQNVNVKTGDVKTGDTHIRVDGGGKGKKGGSSVGVGRDAIKEVKELSNLSVGKLLEVQFERDGNKASVPVQLRLAVTNTDSESMKTIMGYGSIKNTFKERWFRMRAGELGFVKDLLMCQDLKKEYTKARTRDKSGFFEHMMRRRSKNFLSGLLSMSPSLNNASAVLVVSEETAKRVELEIGGKLSHFRTREKVFADTAAMIIVVVDQKWQTVTFYHRSIDTPTEMSVRELKRAGGGSGSDVEDIIRAYSAGSAPAI